MNNKRDQLEELIIQNKQSMEERLPDNHMQSFQAKLKASKALKEQPAEKTEKKRLSVVFRRYIPLTAAMAAGFILALFIMRPDPRPAPELYLPLSEIRPEYREAEEYFTTAAYDQEQQVAHFVSEGILSKEEQKIMKSEMENFDETILQLQKELQANPNDTRVVNAMIRLYKTRLKLIERIVDDLERVEKDVSKETMEPNETHI